MALMKDVLHVSKLAYSLSSVSTLVNKGLTVSFFDSEAMICSIMQRLAIANLRNKLFILQTKRFGLKEQSLVANLEKWRERMGHIDSGMIPNMIRNSVVTGLTIKHHNHPSACESFIKGKMIRADFPNVFLLGQKASCVLDVVHTDIRGPIHTTSKECSRYFITFIGKALRCLEVYPVNTKDQTFETFKM